MTQQEPFAQQSESDPFALGEITRFKARDTHAPSFYTWRPPWEDAQRMVVCKDGVPIEPGFYLSEVAPERWWSVLPDGNVMDQRDFEGYHERWHDEHYLMKEQPPEESTYRHVPDVCDFAAYRVSAGSPERVERIVRIEEDPDAISPIFDSHGNVIQPDTKLPRPPVGFDVKPSPPQKPDTNFDGESVEDKIARMRREIEELESTVAPEEADDESDVTVESIPEGYQMQPCGTVLEKRKVGPHSRGCDECRTYYEARNERTKAKDPDTP